MPPSDSSPSSAAAVAAVPMIDAPPRRAHPLLWVPTLYLAMGAPMITVSVVAAIFYKNMGLTNAEATLHTGAMYLPWMLKPLWAPVVEMFRTKRFFVLAMELTMLVTLGCVALVLGMRSWFPWTLALFWVTGFASATQDVAADGVYISSTTPREQALYVGVQGICWSIGRIIASGLLVSFTGYLHDDRGLPWARSWMIVFGILAALMAASAAWHARVLPSGGRAADAPKDLREAATTFWDATISFFRKPRIWMMIGVVLFYRLGEGLIETIGPLFLLDARNVGGLGLNNVQLGNINGTYGTVGFIAGTLLGGWFSAKLGLRRSFFVLALALNVPHVTYFYLSHALPDSVLAVTTLVTIEKFGYGLGSVGHMLYMMQQLAPGPYRTAHYAFATGLMAASMTVTKMSSGLIQQATGYQTFFAIVLLASIPPLVFAWFAPFPLEQERGAAVPAGH